MRVTVRNWWALTTVTRRDPSARTPRVENLLLGVGAPPRVNKMPAPGR